MNEFYSPTYEELTLIKQHNKNVFVKIQVFNDRNCENYSDEINGSLINDSLSIDSESTQRKTYSCTLAIRNAPKDKNPNLYIGPSTTVWINKYMRVWYGIKSNRTLKGEYTGNDRVMVVDNIFYWLIGTFTMVTPTYSFSGSGRTLSLSCADLMMDFDGTKNGKITATDRYDENGNAFRVGALEETDKMQLNMSYKFIINSVASYSETKFRKDGTRMPESYVTMKQAILGTLRLADIATEEEYRSQSFEGKRYSISGYDLGANKDVPYKLEFTPDNTFNDVWTKLAELFPNYEYFFDVTGKFIWRQIPTGYESSVVMTNRMIDPLLVSEEHANSFSGIYNCTEVWGRTFELGNNDRYASTSTYDNGTYNITLYEPAEPKLGKDDDRNDINCWYGDMDQIAFKASSDNTVDHTYLKITTTMNTGSTPPNPQTLEILDAYGDPIKKNVIKNGKAYVTTFHKKLSVFDTTTNTDKNIDNCLVLSGSTQAYGYYEEKSEDCPFSTNPKCLGYKIANRVVVDDYSNDDYCQEWAERLTYQSCVMQDTITLNMIIVPQLDVNQKISYISNSDVNREELMNENDTTKIPQYMIKSISQSTMDGTMSLTAYKFNEDFSYVWNRRHKNK